MNVKGSQVFVGLSGGVDSAMTAALLQRAGAKVTGVFIKGWYPPGLPCTWSEDRRDAMRVAARLGIPFRTLDASAEYKQDVIEYLIREYSRGRTPNPDVFCNRDVKFGAFYRYARQEGADFIATGHYARVTQAEPKRVAPMPHVPQLTRGTDESKDQSYFLWAVPEEALAMTLFPLGDMHKSEVRRLAKEYGLPNADKRDSQGICFLGPVSIEDFLRKEVGLSEGKLVDEAGIQIGTHHGAIAYTLGERIAALGGPWYVIQKDLEGNTIVAARSPRAAAGTEIREIELIETNWLAPIPSSLVEAQYRYHGPRVGGRLAPNGTKFAAALPLTEPIAPGQSLVVYDGDRVIGGGIIQ